MSVTSSGKHLRFTNIYLSCILNHYILKKSSKRLFDIGQKMSNRRIADEQTLKKMRLPDVNTHIK